MLSSSALSAIVSTRRVHYPRLGIITLTLPHLQVEFIIMGGTFMSLPESYRSQFVSQLHNSLSGYNGSDIDEAVR